MQVIVTGIEEAIANLDRLKDIHEPAKQALYEVIKEAEDIVRAAYSAGGYGHDEHTGFEITVEENEDGYTLRAFGEDVGFLEFGAGIGVDPDEFADEVDFNVTPGSWSETLGTGKFAKHGFWWHNGNYYTWIMATRGMQQALDYIRNNVVQRIQEKITEWTKGN